MGGKIFVVDGLDGSGKQTQTQLVYERLKRLGKNVRLVDFPQYNSESSALVRYYLGGGLGTDLEQLNPYGVALFYTVDRYITWVNELREFYEAGGIIICDRYLSANQIYQGSRFAPEELKAFCDWCYDLECDKIGLPRDTKTILLRVHPETTNNLMRKRYKGDEGKKDIHEANMPFLYKCYDTAMAVADHCGWVVIDCENNGELRSIEEIHEDVFKVIAKELER